jgi:hypothetical protein
MHMHAKAAGDFGPPPRPLRPPVTSARALLAEVLARGVREPQCAEPILSPLTDEAMIEQTVDEKRCGRRLDARGRRGSS